MLCARCNHAFPAAPTCPDCGADPYLRGPAEAYRLEAVIGQGGLGTTYRATRLRDGLPVAVKELPLRAVERAKLLELFEREAQTLRQLRHPGIPAYHDHFTDGHGKHLVLCLVQALIPGQTLAQESQSRRYNEAEVWQVVAEVCDILIYLHGLSPPVIHRDLKPANVMRHADGHLVLIDFGAVRDSLKGPQGGSTVAGTFGFMPPEQFAGVATPATDLYALGALALSLLTRRDPSSLLDHRHRLQWRDAVSLSPQGVALLSDLLEPDHTRRLQRASNVRERALALPDEGTAPPKQSPTAPARPSADERPDLGAIKRAHHARVSSATSRLRPRGDGDINTGNFIADIDDLPPPGESILSSAKPQSDGSAQAMLLGFLIPLALIGGLLWLIWPSTDRRSQAAPIEREGVAAIAQALQQDRSDMPQRVHLTDVGRLAANASPPLVMHIHEGALERADDAPLPDLIGVFVHPDPKGDARGLRYVEAFDAQTLERLWSVGPFGYDDPDPSARLWLAAERPWVGPSSQGASLQPAEASVVQVLSPSARELWLYRLSDGEPVKVIDLPALTGRVCTLPSGDDGAYIVAELDRADKAKPAKPTPAVSRQTSHWATVDTARLTFPGNVADYGDPGWCDQIGRAPQTVTGIGPSWDGAPLIDMGWGTLYAAVIPEADQTQARIGGFSAASFKEGAPLTLAWQVKLSELAQRAEATDAYRLGLSHLSKEGTLLLHLIDTSGTHPTGGTLLALNVHDGQLLWQAAAGAEAIYAGEGDSSANTIYLLERAKGAAQWEVVRVTPRPQPDARPLARPRQSLQ
jgi:serine/threonine protein kinase